MTDDAAQAPAGKAAQSHGPGATLRAARERRGLAIAAVTEALHVESRVIEALEADRYSQFDAPVYARGFLRKYGSFLELPVEELLDRYESLAGGPTAPTLIPVAQAEPLPRDWSALRRPAALLLALVLAGGGYAWWAARAPAPASRPHATPAAVAPPAAAAGTQPAAGLAAAATAGSADALQVAGLRECWMEVYSPTGARLLYDMVRPGESHALPGPGPWRVFLGNADGVRLSVGDRVIRVPPARRAGATARFVVAGDGAVN